jgi:hypothetical protein
VYHCDNLRINCTIQIKTMTQHFILTQYRELKNRYAKLKKSYEKRIQTGLFSSLSKQKQNAVISKLEKYRRQLNSLLYIIRRAITKGLVSASILVGITTALTFTSCTDDDPAPLKLEDITFTEQTVASNPFNGVEIGYYNANITFGDVDGDGDLDVFIGEYYGRIKYFKNTGSATAPAFTEQTSSNNPMDGKDLGSSTTPNLVDINNDGKLDLLIGEGSGNINFFLNTGSSTVPAFTEKTGADNPFNGVNLGSNSSPAFADIDKDGDQDCFVLASYYTGYISYFKNTGSASAPVFAKQATSPLTDAHDFSTYSTLVLGDIDKDGDMDAFVAEFGEDKMYSYENTGNASTPTFAKLTGDKDPFDGISVDGLSISLADIDKDGDLDAFIGVADYYATIKFYKNAQ